MRRGIRIVLAGLLSAAPMAAVPPPSPEWASKVDAIFAPLADGKSPGCAVAVIQDGAIAYEKGYGLASLEFGVPIAPDTIFDIGSVSKQFTAATVIRLAQDGKLSLDDDVRQWIPELPPYRPTVTIRHLFHHTSGIRDYTDLMSLAGARVPDRTTKDEALEMIVRQKGVDFPAGLRESYSNSGYFLLSVIVERAAGKGLAEVSREKLFAPLGMNDTQFLDDSRRIVPRKATGYGPKEGGGFRLAGSNWEQIGDGSLLTTVRDLAKWVRNFEEPKVGGPAFVTAMEEVGMLADGSRLEYASGLRVDTWRGLRRVSHSGAWAGYRAALVRFPTEKTAFAATCNRLDAAPSALLARAAEIVLAGRLARAPDPPPARKGPFPVSEAEAGRLQGLYVEPSTLEVRRVERKDGGLVFRRGESVMPLRPNGTETYGLAFGETELAVRFSAAGAPATTMRLREGGRDNEYYRTDAWSPAPGTQELSGFVGEFDSEEIGAIFRVALEGDRLMLHRRGADPTPLTPLFRDAF
ncbi:MAG TPA: serine hydrolase domain-containing protein, partial [Thermoanaerobaculia bacterium]